MFNTKMGKLFGMLLPVVVFSLLFVKVSEKKILAPFGLIFSLGGVALADNEVNEKDSNDDEQKESTAATQQISSSSSTSSKPQTYTQVIKLPDQIVTKTIMADVVLPDSDKDGLPDASDPHPTIPEYIIVSDANGNGIDDNYDISI